MSINVATDAVVAAKMAAHVWERAGIAKRLEVLQEAGREFAAAKSKIVENLAIDGLSIELASTYADWIIHSGDPLLLKKYARQLAEWHPSDPATGLGGELLVRRPDGLVLLITPGNSPTFNSSPVFSMLLPGNGVIVRAPDNDKGVRFLVEEILQNALARHGFSRELVSVVTGKSRDILDQFASRPEIHTIVFFGNSVSGRAVAQLGYKHNKKVVLELDGSDHMVVWHDAPLEAAIESARRAFDFSTQPCLVPKHFLVHEQIHDRFLAALLARLSNYSSTVEADPTHGVLVPVVRKEDYFAALAEARKIGEVHCGGYQMAANGNQDDQGDYIAPTLVTVDADYCLNNRPLICIDEEIFFPLVPIIRFRGSDSEIAAKMSALMERAPFGLHTSVWTTSNQIIEHFTRETNWVGLLRFNTDHTSAPHYASHWGGPKRSGGPYGESHFFWEKTSHLQAIDCNKLTRPQIDAIIATLGCLPID